MLYSEANVVSMKCNANLWEPFLILTQQQICTDLPIAMPAAADLMLWACIDKLLRHILLH